MAVRAATSELVGMAAEEKARAGRSRRYLHAPHSLGERRANAIAGGMGSWTGVIWPGVIGGVWAIITASDSSPANAAAAAAISATTPKVSGAMTRRRR